MGNRSTREEHMMRYGATLKDLERSYMVEGGGVAGDDTSHPNDTSTWSSARTSHLSEPMARLRRDKFIARPRSVGLSPAVSPQCLENVFPALPPDEPFPDVTPYPRDWQHGPTNGSHRAEVKWLYSSVDLTKQGVEPTLATALLAMDRLMEGHSIKPVDPDTTVRHDVRGMIRSHARYGVLFDVIATRRCIMSGAPHDVAIALYDHMSVTYPILVKFTFIGITDNTSKRVARDMFCAVRSGVYGPQGPSLTLPVGKVSFDKLDGDHMYVVNPGDSFQTEWVRSRGAREAALKAAERHKRYFTPKYAKRPDPEWLQKIRLSKKAVSPGGGADAPREIVYPAPSVGGSTRHHNSVEAAEQRQLGAMLLAMGMTKKELGVLADTAVRAEVDAKNNTSVRPARSVVAPLFVLETKPTRRIGTLGREMVARAEGQLAALERRRVESHEDTTTAGLRQDAVYTAALLSVVRRVQDIRGRNV